MKTADILERIDIPRHKLYYLEQKGYVAPRRIPFGDLEAREYSDEDFEKVRLIWHFLKLGFRYRVAYAKAMEAFGRQSGVRSVATVGRPMPGPTNRL
jgi:hypothetical protein